MASFRLARKDRTDERRLPPGEQSIMPLRTLIAEDHELARNGVRSVLKKRIDFEICGEATSGKEAVQKTLALNPDIVILDISMRVLNGLEAARIIRKSSPNTPIVFLSVHHPRQIVTEAHKIGARGYVLKGDAEQNLVKAVDAAVQNQTFFPTN
jgi:two-component system, NarL family, nitrate/nitrite response regulator NarL